ncbi:hypothetical protein HYDPIDRAFT_114369 [Hydnomerulius pinastri MD-312]|uniref:Hydrophobin n=1 Tax=Hydnomerulius pinastri MD-312 TaxID=994086 RepID=A0A0C9WDR8_9AGAM|nr:hypothetical protein HYDPIDRAFT_114369 [Hydnomerulius pinastri MD-312]
MFSSLVAILPLAALVAAGTESQCNTGPIQCCNSVQQASQVSNLESLCGITQADAGVLGLVGLGCTPITVVGTGSACNAQQQPVCCTHNDFKGDVTLGCSPVNINV